MRFNIFHTAEGTFYKLFPPKKHKSLLESVCSFCKNMTPFTRKIHNNLNSPSYATSYISYLGDNLQKAET